MIYYEKEIQTLYGFKPGMGGSRIERSVDLMTKTKDKKVLCMKYCKLDEEYDLSVNKYGSGFALDPDIDYAEVLYNAKDPREGLRKLTTSNSIYSYKFGVSTSDDDDVIPLMYSCKCGKTYGMDKIGLTCEYCNTKVKRAKDKNLGWFKLEYDKIFHPMLCWFLCKEEMDLKDGDGRKSLFTLLSQNKLEFNWDDLFWQVDENNNYSGKLYEFVAKYMKSYKELFDYYSDPEYWYTSSIPVLSRNYRFITIRESNFEGLMDIDQHNLNPEYVSISYLVQDLNNNHTKLLALRNRKRNKLRDLIKTLSNVIKIIYSEFFDGKYAFLKQEQYSRRRSMSGRLIMLPMNDERYYGIDKCVISIDYFRSVFKKNVVKVCKSLRIEPKRIKKLINKNYTLNDDDRKLIREEIFPRINHLYEYTNREPSIYMESALMLKIVDLCVEMIIRVPFFILKAIAGDSKLTGSR